VRVIPRRRRPKVPAVCCPRHGRPVPLVLETPRRMPSQFLRQSPKTGLYSISGTLPKGARLPGGDE
jgi:hypothetical protein